MFVSDSPTRATEAQGALFAAHSAHLDLHYLDSLAQVPLAHALPPPLPPPPPPFPHLAHPHCLGSLPSASCTKLTGAEQYQHVQQLAFLVLGKTTSGTCCLDSHTTIGQSLNVLLALVSFKQSYHHLLVSEVTLSSASLKQSANLKQSYYHLLLSDSHSISGKSQHNLMFESSGARLKLLWLFACRLEGWAATSGTATRAPLISVHRHHRWQL